MLAYDNLVTYILKFKGKKAFPNMACLHDILIVFLCVLFGYNIMSHLLGLERG